jgi:hypothetical protein
MPAPWALTEEPADPAAEEAAREVLSKDGVEVTELFSAGDRIAFAGTQTERYGGQEASMTIVGVMRRTDDGLQKHVVADRLGFQRRLRAAQA